MLALAGLVLATVTAVVLAAPAFSSGPPGGSPEAARLRDVERTRLQALVDADTDVVERLHADDFVLVPPPGFPLARDDYLAAVAAGDLDYLAFEPVSDVDVRLYGNAAVVTYEWLIDIEAAGLGRLSLREAAWPVAGRLGAGDRGGGLPARLTGIAWGRAPTRPSSPANSSDDHSSGRAQGS
jgi:hypothetical protein